MKIVSSILLTALLGFVAGLYLPWWSIAISAFLVSILIPQNAWKSFLSGFVGIFLLWAGLSAMIDFQNDSILSQKIAQILPLGGSTILLMVLTALIGALVAGFGALSGSYIRKKR